MQADADAVRSVPAECDHETWELGCPRCFFEMSGLASGAIHAEDSRRVQEHTLNGGILFGWHVITMLADMEMQLTQIANDTLDLTKRALAANTIKNIHNLSVYVARVCTDTRAMAAALASASELATAMKERMEQEKATGAEPVKPVASSIVLTDLT